MTITVLGTGYVGLTTATLLAHSGHKVFAVEPNKERLHAVQSGKSFFYEEGLDPLVKHVIESGSLVATDSYKDSVPHSDIVFSSVGTPDNADGSPNLEYVFASARAAAALMKPDTTYVQKSTVPVGTGRKVQELFRSLGKEFGYVSNPEFLREGTALADTLWFDRVVVGSDDSDSASKVLNLYKSMVKHRSDIASIANLSAPKNYQDGAYIATSQNSAELIKVTANAFLALKISFANSIAKLADQADADVVEVMDAVGSDKRIGRAFLNAGRGYGGGCFPKDVSGLISSAQQYGVDIGIMQEAAELNASMPGYIANKIHDVLTHGFEGAKIAILGLAFKAGTSDARKSPGVSLANILTKRGAFVTVFDPKAIDEAREDLLSNITIARTTEDCIKDAELTCITTDWKEFLEYDLLKMRSEMQGDIFFDAMNAFDKGFVEKSGLKYIGVGR